MNTKKKKITTPFVTDTRSEATARAVALFRAVLETQFERLQNQLLKALLNRTADPDLNLLYRHAATEAAAVATATGYPLLVLPLLFEEKAEAARLYAERQARILRQTSDTTGVVA